MSCRVIRQEVNLSNVNEVVINDVKHISSRILNSSWKGSIQIVETNCGNFIDNPTMVTYQSKRKPILGFDWSKLKGSLLVKNKDFIFDFSNGYVWLKKI